MKTSVKTYKVYYEPSCRCVVMDWDGYATSSEFREGTEKMLLTLSEHKASKVFADASKMILIGQDDQKWLADNFLPRAVAQGFRAIALVRPRNYFNAVAVEAISRHALRGNLSVRVFNTPAEARAWLGKLDV